MSSTVAATSSRRFTAETRAACRPCHRRSSLTSLAEIFGLLLIATALVWATVATSGPATARVPSQRIRVESGQTLWTLAAQHPVPGMTTEQTAELIATANHIDGGQIDAGAAITIPARADQSLALACR